MRHPFAWATVCFSLGIILTSRLHASFPAAFAIAAVCCILCALLINRDLAGGIALSLAMFFSGSACLADFDTQPLDHIRYLVVKAMNGRCSISGRVASEPEQAGARTTFIVAARRLRSGSLSYACSGRVLMILDGAIQLEYGHEIEAEGEVRLPSGFRGGRRTSIRDYLMQKGIYAILRVRSPCRIRMIAGARTRGIRALSVRMKRRFQDKIHSHLSPIAAGIMEAMLLGDKKNIPRSVYSDMIKSGTVHILVVSGFNVSIVAGILVLVLKVLRVNRIMRCAAIVPALLFYCVMTGASPPVVRATIMGIFFFVSWYVRRDPGIFQALALSAFAIAAINPRQLYDASFQLSFMAVLAIGCLSPLIEKLVRTDRIKERPLRWAAGLAIVSLSAWLGTAGFIAYYFRIVAPITVLANIFIPVLASFITLCGVGLVTAEFLCPYLACSFASVCEFLMVVLLRFNSFLIHIPGAYSRFP
jgi:competence protein ComEC